MGYDIRVGSPAICVPYDWGLGNYRLDSSEEVCLLFSAGINIY